jgi:hypothetical protein
MPELKPSAPKRAQPTCLKVANAVRGVRRGSAEVDVVPGF